MKQLLRLTFAVIFWTHPFIAYAADQTVNLQPSHGGSIKIDIYNPGNAKVLLLAPGQGCSARLDLYDALGAAAHEHNITLVRLYWNYCLSTPESNPSPGLRAEIDDFVTALNHVTQTLGTTDSNLYIGGKSLGTFVSSAVFEAVPSLAGLVMLTPVCTDTSTPGVSHNVFAEQYPGLVSETRPVILIQGNADPLCDTHHFQEYLATRPNNFISLTTVGNHGLLIQKPDGTFDDELGLKNLRSISKWLMTWL